MNDKIDPAVFRVLRATWMYRLTLQSEHDADYETRLGMSLYILNSALDNWEKTHPDIVALWT